MTSGQPWKERAWEKQFPEQASILEHRLECDAHLVMIAEKQRAAFMAGIQAKTDHDRKERVAETRRRKARKP